MNFFDKIVYYFLPEDKREEGYSEARVFTILLLSIFGFMVTYTTYFQINSLHDPFKNIIDIIALIFSITSVLVFKKRGNYKESSLIIGIAGFSVLYYSTYLTGGINSSDIVWFPIIVYAAFLLLGIFEGLLFTILTFVSIWSFYLMEKHGLRDFELDKQTVGVFYDFMNISFALIFTSVISFAFLGGKQKLNERIQQINDGQIDDLGNRFKFITENAQELIGLHNQNLQRKYISPSIFPILGYKINDFLGKSDVEFMTEKSKLDFESDIESKRIFNKNFQSVYEYIHKNGTIRNINISFRLIENLTINKATIISIGRDVTEKVALEQKMIEMRHQIAQDFHDEIGNRLASVSTNANLLKALIKVKEPKIDKILNKIQDNSSSLYHDFKDFLWSIDLESERPIDLFTHLKDFGESYFENSEIDFYSNKNFDVATDIKLEMNWKRNVILIVKEIMTNALKYSAAETLTMNMSIDENNQIEIEVIDNGKGFDVELVKNGMGLNNMNERSAKIGVNLKIESEIKKGTKTVLTSNF